MSLEIWQVESDYLDYLRQFDSKVPNDDTHTRKFLGVIIEVNGCKYYAPLSSPKPNHAKTKTSDIKVHLINNTDCGSINLRYMIPVPEEALVPVDVDTLDDEKYRFLVMKQLRFIKKSSDVIQAKASRLYKLVLLNHKTFAPWCCDFKLLEEKCKEYEGREDVQA